MIRNIKHVLAAFVFGLSAIGCAAPSAIGTSTEQGPTELREYQGQELSSVNDFRENSIRGPQNVDINAYRLRITGRVNETREYTYDEILNLPAFEKVSRLDCVEGWGVTILWEGISVRDLLTDVGVGPAAITVIFHAHDGYTTSFPVEYIMQEGILLAYKMNGITVPPERGYPLVLVVEDKWGYKWIKWVTEIELSNDVTYRGYWESRGYSNSGDRDAPFFGR